MGSQDGTRSLRVRSVFLRIPVKLSAVSDLIVSADSDFIVSIDSDLMLSNSRSEATLADGS
jgi:hypothetical protein